MSQLIDDNKSVYIREDLTYNLIRYNNLGVIKVDEFRKVLGISNNFNQFEEKETIIALIMKIFAKESVARQYKIHGFQFDVDLCFTVSGSRS